MAFEKTLPTWNNVGVEPPESLKTSGWEANQKPPAPYFNWLQNTTYEAIKELQEKAADKNEISIPDASTTQKGAVQLTTSTDSTSTTLAPTASALKTLKDSISYQTPTLSGVQIRLVNNTNSTRLFFKLNTSLNGNITISTDGGTTSKNLVDIDGVQVTSLDKGFVEVVAESNFFILRNSGLSKSELQQLIAIANEIEANESVVKTNYINVINTAEGTTELSNNATWNDVLLQIPNVNSNRKKFATGQGVFTVEGNIHESITITLDFKPTIILFHLYRSDSPNLPFACSYNGELFPTRYITYTYGDNNIGNVIDGVNAYVNETGFKLNVGSGGKGNMYYWYAFE